MRMPATAPSRAQLLERMATTASWDIIVIGGGATGLGVALDAAVRGFSTVLVESEDFAKGTSSRATKLVHGGVRYLSQGNIGLVYEALRERTRLLANAPHIAQPLAFVVPMYGTKGRWWDKWFYGIGLVMYDVLAGKAGLGKTRLLNRAQTLQAVPGAQPQRLVGGVRYWDGQFDDARLAVALARTAIARGACVVNHCAAVDLLHEGEQVAGVTVEDRHGGRRFELRSRCVVNAAGVWVDGIRRMDNAAAAELVAPSQGVHLVVDREFLRGDQALMVPKTSDGRVLFAVPWLGKVVLGTTDTPRHDLAFEPAPFKAEVDFILNEAGHYLARPPTRADVRSVWVGLRPLVKPENGDQGDTKAISREHVVRVSKSGLVTITGGKWTTYRAMAEDVLAQCVAHGVLSQRAAGATVHLPLVGAPERASRPLAEPPGPHLYGTEAEMVAQLPGADRELAPGLTEAMVRFAARYEYALSVEDVLARRSRLLFLDARLAASLADAVAQILASELGADFDAPASAAAFRALAAQYSTVP